MYAKSIDEVDTIIKHNNALFEAGVPIVPTLVDHPVVIEGVPAMVIPMAETGESVSPFIVGEMTRQLHHLSRNLDAINNYNHPYRDTRLVNSYRDNLSTHLDPSQLSTIEWLIEKVEKLAEDTPLEPQTVIHGDIHPGNIVIYQGRPCFIDVDGTARSHPGLELGKTYASIAQFCRIPSYLSRADLFLAGYGEDFSAFDSPEFQLGRWEKTLSCLSWCATMTETSPFHKEEFSRRLHEVSTRSWKTPWSIT